MAIQYNEETKTLILTSPEDLEARGRLEQHVSAEHIVFEKDITIIPESINGILREFKDLESIQGDGVVTVEDNAFNSLEKLKTVTLPKVTTIGTYAFKKCFQLEEIDLHSATTIGGYAFDRCQCLATINLPDARSIGGGAFRGCKNLKGVDLPKVT